MIYTSYFANLKRVKNPIAICGKSPDFYKGVEFKKLAPKYSFFRDWKDKVIGNDEYIRLYNKLVLEEIDIHETVKELFALYPGLDLNSDITLLCYEKPGDFCHRNIVKDWLNKNGYKCEEANNK